MYFLHCFLLDCKMYGFYNYKTIQLFFFENIFIEWDGFEIHTTFIYNHKYYPNWYEAGNGKT